MPDRIQATGSLSETGVDGQIGIALGYGDRAQASLHTTLCAETATTAVIAGTEGRIEVERRLLRPDVVHGAARRRHLVGLRPPGGEGHGGGFQYQAAEVARRVAEGATESPRMTWQSTLDVMATMDEVRRQIGLRYPGE